MPHSFTLATGQWADLPQVAFDTAFSSGPAGG
jgi:hypothetical protein